MGCLAQLSIHANEHLFRSTQPRNSTPLCVLCQTPPLGYFPLSLISPHTPTGDSQAPVHQIQPAAVSIAWWDGERARSTLAGRDSLNNLCCQQCGYAPHNAVLVACSVGPPQPHTRFPFVNAPTLQLPIPQEPTVHEHTRPIHHIHHECKSLQPSKFSPATHLLHILLTHVACVPNAMNYRRDGEPGPNVTSRDVGSQFTVSNMAGVTP